MISRPIKAEVIPFDDYEELFSKFDSKELDILAAEGDGAYGRQDADVLFSFGGSDYYLCTNRNKPELLAELNTAQSLLSAEEPNYLNNLKTRYYPISVSSRAFSATEKEWILTHDRLKIGYMENYLPYSDTDENGNVTGIIKDIIPEILRELGMEGVEISYHGYKNYDDMMADLRSDNIDTAFPVGGGLYYSEENGIGIGKEFQKSIFEAFTREKTSTVSGIQGTGLGMAITKNIVDLMGGTISVDSEEGKGSEFTVYIPCKLAKEVSDKEETVSKDYDFSGKRVLLVEDNEMNRMIANAILTELGFEVDNAENGKEAVDKLMSNPAGCYDIVLMDIQMPVMDGYEATRAIRALEDKEKSAIPIVAVTANAFEEDKKMAMDCGMNGHLAKPYDIPQITETLAKLLDC